MAEEIDDHKHIFGGIKADGTKLFGDGFESKKTSSGYIVTFKDPEPKTNGFQGQPSAVCTIYGSDPLLIRVTEVTPEFFTCKTTTSSGAAHDSAFTFIAFGKNPDYR